MTSLESRRHTHDAPGSPRVKAVPDSDQPGSSRTVPDRLVSTRHHEERPSIDAESSETTLLEPMLYKIWKCQDYSCRTLSPEDSISIGRKLT